MLPDEAWNRNIPFCILCTLHQRSIWIHLQFIFSGVTSKKFWLRLKGVTMKELFDHLKLAQIAFECRFATKFTCVTRNAVQLKKGTVTLLSVKWGKHLNLYQCFCVHVICNSMGMTLALLILKFRLAEFLYYGLFSTYTLKFRHLLLSSLFYLKD